MISKGLRWLRGGRSVSQRFPEGLAPWRVVGASITGSSHQRFGEPCQDAAGWALGPERSLIVAVADGAGSAKLGGEGARLAISTAIDHLTGRRSLGSGESHEKDLIAALERARSALASEAEDLSLIHISEPTRRYAISYAVFCLKTKTFIANVLFFYSQHELHLYIATPQLSAKSKTRK